MVRLEVQVIKDDAPLVRAVAAALADPAQRSAARAVLREHFSNARSGFKAFLASAPLDGVPLTRTRNKGRRVTL